MCRKYHSSRNRKIQKNKIKKKTYLLQRCVFYVYAYHQYKKTRSANNAKGNVRTVKSIFASKNYTARFIIRTPAISSAEFNMPTADNFVDLPLQCGFENWARSKLGARNAIQQTYERINERSLQFDSKLHGRNQ